MRITAMYGSRNPAGKTAGAIEPMIADLRSQGASVDRLFLPKMRIERCRQCDETGWGTCRTENRCCVDDDFAAILDKIRASDAVLFATPVYSSDLSESMRALLDRLRRVSHKAPGKNGFEGKAAMGICVAGGGGGGAPACCLSLEKVLSTCGFAVLDMVPVRRQNLEMKAAQLKLAAAWLAHEAANK